MPAFHQLQEDYAGHCNFLAVYIREAHASDEWPLGSHVCLTQHQTLADRLQDRQNLANFDDIEAVPELDEFGPVPVAPPPAASRREDKPTFVRLAEIRR